ncbi:branched-chain amino acid transaminase [Streptantibioticus ferralitis]|uniref:Branched-chain-amino-acid aminotransferase n=1 Tax=Streptantibioticus ferralitis TaxID=236510 RepID=A0ABT5ZBJ1_9ACTN|nr:branched-chain amino acid transaminase [Streptantibioticus ferralitis]MDF2261088.1 branched-chain amino acid transaminase [Streptantibioticus ferralitis]
MIEPSGSFWLDGALVPSTTGAHLLTHTLHTGFGVLEGIRCYRLDDGSVRMFRGRDHMRRLLESAAALGMEAPNDLDQLVAAGAEAVRANELADAYLRPLVYSGEPNVIFAHWLNTTHVAMIAFPWTGYSDRDRAAGTTATVSPYPRPAALASFYKAKACGHYVLSVTAYSDARRRGYGQAIFCDENGLVAESTGENVFAVIDDVVCTPSSASPILMGITRDAVLKIAGDDLGYAVAERDLTVDELYRADEVFTTGTASELLPVPEIDGHKIGTGALGPVTSRIQERFNALTHGRFPDTRGWLDVEI